MSCTPSSENTLDDCLIEASKSPTELGVRVAAQACFDKDSEKYRTEKLKSNKGPAKFTPKRCDLYFDGYKILLQKVTGPDFETFEYDDQGRAKVILKVPKALSFNSFDFFDRAFKEQVDEFCGTEFRRTFSFEEATQNRGN